MVPQILVRTNVVIIVISNWIAQLLQFYEIKNEEIKKYIYYLRLCNI